LKKSLPGLDYGLFSCTYGLIAIGFNAVLLFFLDPETDYLIWFILNIIAAFSLHFLLLQRKRHKFRNPIDNCDVESLLKKAEDRLSLSKTVELWKTDEKGLVIANTSNLRFSCIILSDSVITGLIQKPLYGEVIIANELLQIDRAPRKFSFIGDFMHYFVFSSATYVLQESFFRLVIVPVGAILLQTIILIMAAALVTITLTSRRPAPIKTVESVYGISIQDAEHEVFGKIDRSFFSFYGRSASKGRIDESSEFKLGMLPIPILVAIICGSVAFNIFTTVLSVLSDNIPYIIVPLSVFFASIGFGFSFELMNPIKYESSETSTDFQSRIYEDEQSQTLAELFHAIPRYAGLEVRKRRLQTHDEVIDIGDKTDYTRNFAMLSGAVLQILTPDELLVFAIAQMKQNETMKKGAKKIIHVLGVVVLLVVLTGVWAFLVIHIPMEELIILLLFVFGGLMVGTLALFSMRNQDISERIDLDVHREYPTLYGILEKLQDRGNPFEMSAYKKRFQVLKRRIRVISSE
jgi:hypothetical protein